MVAVAFWPEAETLTPYVPGALPAVTMMQEAPDVVNVPPLTVHVYEDGSPLAQNCWVLPTTTTAFEGAITSDAVGPVTAGQAQAVPRSRSSAKTSVTSAGRFATCLSSGTGRF